MGKKCDNAVVIRRGGKKFERDRRYRSFFFFFLKVDEVIGE